VRTFRHAVSLDERRAKFKPNLWNRPSVEETKLGSNAKSTTTATATRASSSATPAAAAVRALAVHQSTMSSDDDPDSSYDAKDFILQKGFTPTNILPTNILPPSLRSSAQKDRGADVKGGDTLKDKSDKDGKNLNSNLNGHTKSQKGRGFKKEDTGDRELNTLERLYSEKNERTTDIEEVWFAVRFFFSFLKSQR
jgi:hypothetical protein